ncbi:hypothetical protein Vretimale_11577 [Volvox reticuliferus]|uniref:Uncharacterized protein n=1 Tax=Volvox reticuliferus TaxID=1737510 RepID=A0A8J4CS86_9CHLO|nr:hypothetical protein Vretifemale_14845 [Volvox reticuliferus]GIM07457.1 hypothetical protein Vretimale_11577 [Volvox reticuliferus]
MYSPSIPPPPKVSTPFRTRPSSRVARPWCPRLPSFPDGLRRSCSGSGSGSGSVEFLTRAGRDRVLDAIRKAVGRVPDGVVNTNTFQQPGSLDAPVMATSGNDMSGRWGARQGEADADGWHKDDPYEVIRPDGGHAMRWWTYFVAAMMAVGGLLTTLCTGLLEPLQLGWGTAALLVLSGAAMSNVDSVPGALGVKVAWAVCALVVLKEVTRSRLLMSPGLSAWMLLALVTCIGYMLTDMSALDEVMLPSNPGSVFKSPNVPERSRVWHEWGYGQVQMRE